MGAKGDAGNVNVAAAPAGGARGSRPDVDFDDQAGPRAGDRRRRPVG